MAQKGEKQGQGIWQLYADGAPCNPPLAGAAPAGHRAKGRSDPEVPADAQSGRAGITDGTGPSRFSD